MIANYDNNANYISLVIWNKNGSNVLTSNSLSSAYKLETLLHEFVATDQNNNKYQYTDFCARDFEKSPVRLHI